MKIRKLHLKNIGVFDDEEIEFKPCSAKDKAEIHIFTGQNGSGKSTILMALASTFDNYGQHREEVDFLKEAKNIAKTISTAKTEEEKRKKQLAGEEYFQLLESYSANVNNETISPVPSPFFKRFRNFQFDQNKNSISSEVSISFETGNVAGVYACSLCNFLHSKLSGSELAKYKRNVIDYNYPLYNFEFAVFAYSGSRNIENNQINTIHDDFSNPLKDSLSFTKEKYHSSFTVNQWLANNISKSALARENNNEKQSQKFKQSVQSLENVISEIIGQKIKFVLELEPTNLLIEINNQKLDFDVLPDGLRSLISWIGDLLMRVDLLKWADDLPINEKNLILFLDEIEIHLHPAWQRKVLPVVQKLFKNSQIFISTHSPFVINSVDDAWVYKLELENGKARISDVVKSEDGFSYRYVLREIFGITEQFGVGVQKDLDKFYELRDKVLENGSKTSQKDFLKLAKALAEQSEELNRIVQSELRQISEMKGKEFSL